MSTRGVGVSTWIAGLGCLAMLGACGSGGQGRVDKVADAAAALDPKALQNKEGIPFNIGEQRELIERVWRDSKGTPAERREAVKKLVWATGTGSAARKRGLDLLASDETDVDSADTRTMLSLMLPVEPDYAVTQHASELIAQRNWTDLSPALIRSLARGRNVLADEDRAEAKALLALYPGRSLEQIAFAQFSREPSGTGRALERQERERSAAWELLGRLDRDGSKRAALVADPSFAAGAGSSSAAAELQATAAALGAVPVTGEQLTWARKLRSESTAGTWWAEATSAIAGIPMDKRQGWGLRHAEAARWAGVNRPAWLKASRDELVAEVTARLKDRTHYTRVPEGADAVPGREGFLDQQRSLLWGDLLVLLVVDEALRAPGVAEALWKQADRDRSDTSTELGGVLGIEGGAWIAKLFPPRGSQRMGDNRFVASDELINQSTFALAHYHFHAQEVRNARYAGPSPGDAEYAARHGRTCIVFTPVRAGVLNADVLLPTGQTVDLGELNGTPGGGGGR